MEEEESKANPPLLSDDDNASFQDTDVNKIQPPAEIMGSQKNMTVTQSGMMVLKVPEDNAQLTSKKNSNITSEANDSNKSNQPKEEAKGKSE